MERASIAFTEWFTANYDTSRPIHIVCGPGNNGGDGLAVARLLDELYYKVEVSLFLFSEKTSADFDANLNRLQTRTSVPIHYIHEDRPLPVFAKKLRGLVLIFPPGFLRTNILRERVFRRIVLAVLKCRKSHLCLPKIMRV